MYDSLIKSSEATNLENALCADQDDAVLDFIALGNNPGTLTARMTHHLGTSAEQFCSWRWQMRHQVVTASEASRYFSIDDQEKLGFSSLNDLFNAGITPYYMGLMTEASDAACPIRLQALPRHEETNDLFGLEDPLLEVTHSPVKEVVHVYPDRVAFCVAQLCPVYCRYCFRNVVDRGLAYIAANPAIRDVLITGGDPFIAHDATIENLLQRLRAIPHVEIIRFGTRTPVTLPYRVTKRLAALLAKYHPVFVNTHFNCAEELTAEARLAVANLVNAGIPVGNQAVLLRGVNDSSERMLDLCRNLLNARVRPYYVFHPHTVAGTKHLRVSVQQGLHIMRSLRGRITGMGIPSYILDTPSGKVPLSHNYILGEDGEDLIIETPRGEIWRERKVLLNDY